MPQISVKIDDRTKEFLDQMATDTNRSTHSLAGQALTEFTERYAKRIAYIKEAVQAAGEYEETGMHITNEEINQWAQDFVEGKSHQTPIPHL